MCICEFVPLVSPKILLHNENRKLLSVNLIETLKHLFHPQRSNNHRPKFLHPKPLFFLALIAIGFYQSVGVLSHVHSASGSILGYASNISVSQVVSSTNSVRSDSGLGSLQFNQQLAQAATAKAQNMFSEGYWAHTSPSGKEPWDFIKSAGYSYKIAGENLARDFDSTSPLMDAWMNSPTHRANIMNPRYQEIGIAVVDGLLNGVETTLVVQMFGTPISDSVTQQPSVAVPAAIVKVTPIPTVQPLVEPLQQPNLETDETMPVIQEETSNEVLAEAVVPEGSLSNGILYSPVLVLKAFFLSIIFILISVLTYDAVVSKHRDTVRFVGKNIAHIIFFIVIAYLILVFKGGVVGP